MAFIITKKSSASLDMKAEIFKSVDKHHKPNTGIAKLFNIQKSTFYMCCIKKISGSNNLGIHLWTQNKIISDVLLHEAWCTQFFIASILLKKIYNKVGRMRMKTFFPSCE